MKYAELPGGKILKFPDEISDRDMQRAVRRELGLQHEDMLVAVEKFGNHADRLLDSVDAQDKRLKETMDKVIDSIDANSSRSNSAISDTLRSLSDAHERHSREISKAVNSVNVTMGIMRETIGNLNKTMDMALGESFSALDENRSSMRSSEETWNRNIGELRNLVYSLNESVSKMSELKKTRRTARRNRDGSYTFE